MGLFGRKDPEKLAEEALECLNAGEPEQALAKLDDAIRLDPKHAMAWYIKGTIHGSRGQYPEAVSCYATSAKHAPPSHVALPLYNLGNVYQSIGDVAKALECFTLATEAAPDMAEAWINRGRILDDTGEHAEAVQCYDTALSLTPDDVDALSNRGNSLRALGQWEKAMADYHRALQLDPANAPSLVGAGICLGRLGDPKAGLKSIDRGLKLFRHPPSLAERATLLAMLQRYDEALAAIDESIQLGAGCPQAWNNRGEFLAKLGRADEALASFDKALGLDSRYAPSLFGKTRVQYHCGRVADARKTIGRYFEVSDGSDGLGEEARALAALCQRGG